MESNITISSNEKKTVLGFPLLFSLFTSIILVLSLASNEKIQEVITVFMMPFFYSLIIGLFTISLVVSIIFAIRNFKKIGSRSVVPLLINLVTVAFFMFVPVNQIKTYNSFYRHLEKRMEIVEKVINKDLIPGNTGQIWLPDDYKGISAGDRIRVGQYNNSVVVYFYVNEGFLESSSGYAFFADDSSYYEYGFIDLLIKEDYGNGWFYCSTR